MISPYITGACLTAAVAVVLTGCAVSPSSSGSSDATTVTFGYLLPETGAISSLGAPQIAALELAAADINAAGGADGKTVNYTGADEAGDPAVAGQAVERLIADRVPAIFGAGSSAITLSVLDKVSGAGIVQCSGMNTSPSLSDYPDDGDYFRTVPSDTLQGGVLAKTIAGGGAKSVAIVARSDSYGSGIADATEKALKAAGVRIATRVDYDPSAQSFGTESATVAAAHADAIALFSYDEGAAILQSLIQNGVDPKATSLYGTDGMPLSSLAATVDPSNPATLQGMTYTQASSGEGSSFTKRLLDTNPSLKTTAFTPYFYDCAILTSLAIEKAGSVDPARFKTEIIGLTTGDEKCTSYADCKKLINDGRSISYEGAAGRLALDSRGEPTTGLYDILRMKADGTLETVDTVTATR